MDPPTIDNYINPNALFKQHKDNLTCLIANQIIQYYDQLQAMGVPFQFKDFEPHPLISLMNNSDTVLINKVLKNYISSFMTLKPVDEIVTDILNGQDLTELLYNIQRKKKQKVEDATAMYDVDYYEAPAMDPKIAYLYLCTSSF